MSWKDMSCKERFAKIVMVLTIALLVVVLVMNAIIIYFSVSDTWFTRCDQCRPGSAPGAPPSTAEPPAVRANGTTAAPPVESGEDCTLCCSDCGLKDEIFFYIMRTYNILFVLLGIASEWRPDRFVEYAKVCSFYFPRGFLYVFLGLLTVTGSLADPEGDVYADVVGYVVVACGVLHLFMGLCCMGDAEELDGGRQDSYEMRGAQSRSDANYGGTPPPGGATGAGGNNNGYEYKYNGQSYTYTNAGPSAI
jgi:hypothetical protein